MNLPPEAVKEFQQIDKEEFGEEISDKEAYDRAASILHLFSILLREDNSPQKHQ